MDFDTWFESMDGHDEMLSQTGYPELDAAKKATINDMRLAFKAGRKARQDWIPVSERLPDNPKTVAVLEQGVFVDTNSYGLEKEGEWHFAGGDKITHWMPLPPAPETDKE